MRHHIVYQSFETTASLVEIRDYSFSQMFEHLQPDIPDLGSIEVSHDVILFVIDKSQLPYFLR